MTIEFTVPNPSTEETSTSENFMNKKRFSKMVERTVRSSELNYMDSIVHMCEQNNMEVEDVKKYLTPSIIDCLETEAMNLNFLEKTNSLDV